MAEGKDKSTSEFLIELVKRASAEKNRSQVIGEPVPATTTCRRALRGVGEPTQIAFEKLAAYLGVSVPWLRSNLGGHQGRMEFDVREPTVLCARCGGLLEKSPEGLVQICPDGTELEGDGILRIWPCSTCCKQ